jgi:hypothetical protein
MQNYLLYHGESTWREIDSDEITYFLTKYQDQLDEGWA